MSSVLISSLTLATAPIARRRSDARAAHADDGDARRAMRDLIEHVDPRAVECLNALTDESWRNALWPGPRDQASLTLVSDDDEELILRVEFSSNVRPRAVKIAGASATHAREDASAPRVVKIFVNAPSLSFENASQAAGGAESSSSTATARSSST